MAPGSKALHLISLVLPFLCSRECWFIRNKLYSSSQKVRNVKWVIQMFKTDLIKASSCLLLISLRGSHQNPSFTWFWRSHSTHCLFPAPPFLSSSWAPPSHKAKTKVTCKWVGSVYCLISSLIISLSTALLPWWTRHCGNWQRWKEGRRDWPLCYSAINGAPWQRKHGVKGELTQLSKVVR